MKSRPVRFMVLMCLTLGCSPNTSSPRTKRQTSPKIPLEPERPVSDHKTHSNRNSPSQLGKNSHRDRPPTTQGQVVSSFYVNAAKNVCENPPNHDLRKKAIQGLQNYIPGQNQFNPTSWLGDQNGCSRDHLPMALFINLISGIPAGMLIGQAVQESGFCQSDLAQKALNLHGQKATVKPEQVTYWHGQTFRKVSSESPDAKGHLVVSEFMKFTHSEYSFYSVAERLVLKSTYHSCFRQIKRPESFIHCIANKWAVHTSYGEKVLGFRRQLNLERCELQPGEWRLKSPWSKYVD